MPSNTRQEPVPVRRERALTNALEVTWVSILRKAPPSMWKRLALGDPWFRSLRCTGLRSLVLLGLWHKTRWQSHLGLSGGILAPVRPRGTSAGKDVLINPRH